MKINEQTYLDLLEQTNRIAFVDIEATGLRGDYNSVLCVSIKPYKSKPVSFHVRRPGSDKEVLVRAHEEIKKYLAVVTYYGKGFDWPMMNTRRLRWGMLPMDPIHHIDLYYTLKYNILTSRKSQGHLLSWLETPERKMGVSATVWNDILTDPAKHMPTMIRRCESDTRGLEDLYKRTRHLIHDIKNSR